MSAGRSLTLLLRGLWADAAQAVEVMTPKRLTPTQTCVSTFHTAALLPYLHHNPHSVNPTLQG